MKMSWTGFVAAALLAIGCGDSDTGDGKAGVIERPTCDEIATTCHHSETTLGRDCHEFGHDHTVTEQECIDRYEECMAECDDGGHGH